MGVPSSNYSTKSSNRYSLVALIALIVVVQVAYVGAENEQHLYYKEYERLQKQIKPATYNWQDQIASNQPLNNRRTPVYQHPQFSSFPNRDTYGVQQQKQRQEQQQHHEEQKILQIENTRYSIWSQNLTYMSSSGYNALGMAPLYNLTNIVIDFFVDAEEPIPPGEFNSWYFMRNANLKM